MSASQTTGEAAPATGAASPARSRALRERGWWPVVGGALLPLAVLAAWWAVTEFTDVPAYRLPSPADVVRAAADLGASGQLSRDIAISTQRVLQGFTLGSLIGIVLGSLIGLSKTASVLLSPTIGALRAVPSLAWVPLLVLYVGIGEPPKIILITIGAAFPVLTTLSIALRHVDPQLVEVGRAYGLKPLGLLAAVQLPAVIPALVSGLRLALAQSWLFLVAAELLSSSMGLGFLLIDSGNNGRVDRIFLAIIVLAILGKATDALIGLLERWLNRRWG
ncbi:ABC transporter permease [Protaetiibacter larvae]|uniref:ABC transporter permease n=1 Tax=Protaetiibacter larvae TaxID=2592654 RepID=A0A5C1YB95_9MICO|nr:ABC transporter permease [Protaetiibacter larvae]QEO10127.1 ABC transporter permease [Protaetiibacter larvae]